MPIDQRDTAPSTARATPDVSLDNSRVLRFYPLEKKPEEIDPRACGVNMPIGGKILGIVMGPGGDHGAVAIVPATGARVWHPLVVLALDEVYSPLIGRSLGDQFWPIPMPGAPVAVGMDLPWPTQEIEGLRPAGHS